MKVLETAATIDLPDRRVAISGDWHGNVMWVRTVAGALARIAPDVTTILHAGDWNTSVQQSDKIFEAAGIERVYVTLGNHEKWDVVSPILAAHPGMAVRVSRITWILPRPFRMVIGGRTFLSLGGATSVDKYWMSHGWSPDEDITDAHVAEAIRGGEADIMITHESPAKSPVEAVQNVLRTNPAGFPQEALIESAASRVRVKQVWDATMPRLLCHGHMHAPGAGTLDDGRRVISLGCDYQAGNLAILNLADLDVKVPSLREVRGW